MLCGIGVYEIRLLCDDPWVGGRGISLLEVIEMSLDQVFMLLTDRKYLKSNDKRSKKLLPLAAASLADKNGYIKGRSSDGSPIKGRITGKSLARQLMEKQEAKKKEEKQSKRRRKKGNKHHGN